MGAVCPHAPAFVPGASRHAARRGATFGTPSQLQKRRRFWRKGGSRCRSSPKRRPPLFPLGSEHIDPAQFRPFGDELGSHGAKVGLGLAGGSAPVSTPLLRLPRRASESRPGSGPSPLPRRSRYASRSRFLRPGPAARALTRRGCPQRSQFRSSAPRPSSLTKIDPSTLTRTDPGRLKG